MKQVRIKDSNFAHDFSTSPEKKPSFFEWVRNNDLVDDKTFVTDGELFKYKGGIAWLIEPPSISPSCYQYISENNNQYKFVLTFLRELSNRGENYLFYPFGGTRLLPNQYAIYNKSKLCSFILSNKQSTFGHKLRHHLKNLVIDNKNIDIFQPKDHNYLLKIDACKDYMFSVVVENGDYNAYFTEKIIDCFLTGVIPIYWGCPSLSEFFDMDGVIYLDNEAQYLNVIESLNKDLYVSKIKSVKRNFELAKSYAIAEDWIYRHYPFLFE
jgi:hypothetical protein